MLASNMGVLILTICSNVCMLYGSWRMLCPECPIQCLPFPSSIVPVDAQEMRLLHREKQAAVDSTRRTERIAIQQALELQTAHNTNSTLAEV